MLTNNNLKTILPPKRFYLITPLFLLALLPAIVLGMLVLRYSVNLPFWDQWMLMPDLFFKIHHEGAISFRDLIKQHNESRKLFPKLIFLNLAYLTHWDVRYEMLAIFLIACFISLSIYVLNRRTVGGSKIKGLIIAFLANLLIFSTVQYDNWFWGIQLVVFVPIASLTAAILVAYSGLSTPAKHLNGLILSIVATFSYANGLLSWILFPLILVLTEMKSWSDFAKKKLLFIPWIIGFIASLIIYFNDFQKPESSPGFSNAINHPIKTVQFFLAFLGSPLGSGIKENEITTSTVIGSIEIVVFLGIIFYLLRHRKNYKLFHRSIGWLGIASYTIISAAVTAAGRVGLGLETSQHSRYTTFSIYLLVALIHLTVIVADYFTSRTGEEEIKVIKKSLTKIGLFAATFALLFFHWQSFNYGVAKIQEWYGYRLSGKSCLAFINVVEKKQCINGNLVNNYPYVLAVANQLNGMGLLKPDLAKSPNLREIAASTKDETKYGAFDGLQKLDNGLFLANGWAILPHRKEPADGVLLTYENFKGKQIIFDLLLPPRTPRKTVAQTLDNPAYLDSGWLGVFSNSLLPGGEQVKISAWAYDAKNGKAYKLHNDLLIGNRE